jgi:hypothetical protein
MKTLFKILISESFHYLRPDQNIEVCIFEYGNKIHSVYIFLDSHGYYNFFPSLEALHCFLWTCDSNSGERLASIHMDDLGHEPEKSFENLLIEMVNGVVV